MIRTIALMILFVAATAAPAQVKGGTTWKGEQRGKNLGRDIILQITVHIDRVVGDRFTGEIVIEGEFKGKVAWTGRIIAKNHLAGYTTSKDGNLFPGFFVGTVEDDTMTGTWEAQGVPGNDGRFVVKRVKD